MGVERAERNKDLLLHKHKTNDYLDSLFVCATMESDTCLAARIPKKSEMKQCGDFIMAEFVWVRKEDLIELPLKNKEDKSC